MSIDKLRQQVQTLRKQLAEVSQASPLPAPTVSLETERQVAIEHGAQEQARQRVQAALTAQLAKVEKELAELELSERKRQAAELRQQVDAGRERLIGMLQEACDFAATINELEAREYSLRNVPYVPQWHGVRRDIYNAVWSSFSKQLRI